MSGLATTVFNALVEMSCAHADAIRKCNCARVSAESTMKTSPDLRITVSCKCRTIAVL